MPRPTTVLVSALNIKTHPHSHDKYVELFQKAFSKRIPVNIRGDQVGIVWRTSVLSTYKKNDVITGLIYKFTNIDPKGDWFNTTKDQDASEDELEMINIPDNLKHNLSQFRFVFLPDCHFLVFESNYNDPYKKEEEH